MLPLLPTLNSAPYHKAGDLTWTLNIYIYIYKCIWTSQLCPHALQTAAPYWSLGSGGVTLAENRPEQILEGDRESLVLRVQSVVWGMAQTLGWPISSGPSDSLPQGEGPLAWYKNNAEWVVSAFQHLECCHISLSNSRGGAVLVPTVMRDDRSCDPEFLPLVFGRKNSRKCLRMAHCFSHSLHAYRNWACHSQCTTWPFFFFNFWLCCSACGILVPQPGIEP